MLDVPADSAKLFPYLQEGAYKAFASETQVHPSAGPHGMVKTFLSSTLDASLLAHNGEHPVGAAAVKELYSSDGRDLIGWSVMVKTADASDGGKGWYWYEITSTTSGANPLANGNGVGLCTGCHGGTDNLDFVLTPYPLR